MSLYNMLNGTHGLEPILGFVLDLDIAGGKYDTGRYRDIWLEDGKIYLYTRNGGGNREEYQYIFDELESHPNYVSDYDDDWDTTYATAEFTYPKEYDALLKHLEPKTKELTLKEKTDLAIEHIGKETPKMSKAKRVTELLEQVLKELKQDTEPSK